MDNLTSSYDVNPCKDVLSCSQYSFAPVDMPVGGLAAQSHVDPHFNVSVEQQHEDFRHFI